MKVGIMQPYFFPYLGYWQLLSVVDKYVVYDDVAYIKGGWINRNNILLNGKAHLITLSLEQSSSFKNINEIDVTHNIKQREKILKTLEAAYKKAPYYQNVIPKIMDLILSAKTIAELNYKTILFFKDWVDLKTDIILSSELEKNNNLKGQDKVIHINKILGSDTYYNAIGGIELYDSLSFAKEGINLFFLKMDGVKYSQYKNEFIPNLSIIDILMFNSPKEIKQLLSKYSLIKAE
jgi:hypothetical protein